MTINEEQELKILSIFVSQKIGRFSSMAFPKELTDCLGSGAWVLVQNMIRDGFVADLHTQEYEFTTAGHIRYQLLRSQKRKEYINKCAFWMIFVCTLVAAVDVIYKHLSPESTPKTLTISAPSLLTPKVDTTHTTLPSTTKYQKKDSGNKKNSF